MAYRLVETEVIGARRRQVFSPQARLPFGFFSTGTWMSLFGFLLQLLKQFHNVSNVYDRIV